MGHDVSTRRWRGRKWLSRTVRLVAHAAPFVVVTAGVWFVHRSLAPADSQVEAAVRWVALSIVATGALIGLDRITRRLLPLATLLKLSLIFPDEAPSRLGVALRQNTTRSLRRDLDAGTLDANTPQAAAELLLSLIGELNKHDRLTRGHAERTRAYADMVGEELGLSDVERSKLQWAALLHDIGKLKVPASILGKPSKPTPREWAALKRHPDEGWKLIAALRPWLGEWARAVRDHHERWDGDGYPRGIAGNQISRAGRIVAVVDTFDVMTSAHSYREAVSMADARAELTRCAGSHFDEDIVRAFLSVGVGRLRLVMGPLTWLAQIPLLARVPVGQIPAAAAATAAAATVAVTAVLAPLPAEPIAAAAREVDSSALPAAFDSLAPSPSTRAEVENAPTSTTSTTSTTTSSTSTTTSSIPATTLPVVTTTAAPATTTTASPSTTTTGPPTTTTKPPTTTTTTTKPPTTTTIAPGPLAEAYLGSFGGGSVNLVLPLTGAPSQTSLPNYDEDQNADPGRTVRRSEGPITGLDAAEMQIWTIELAEDYRAVGVPRVDIWAASPEFDPDVNGQITAHLIVCDSNAAECASLSSATGEFKQKDFGRDFGAVSITLPAVDTMVPGGSIVAIAITVPSSSPADVWLAFDTTSHPARGVIY